MKKKIVKYPDGIPPMAETAFVTLPDIPEDEHLGRDGFSTKLLGGEVTIMVDARIDELKRCGNAKRLLLGMAEAASAAGHISHVLPYAGAACNISMEEGEARAEKSRHDKRVAIGKAQARHLKAVNDERARQCPDYRPALKFARELAARTQGKKPHGFWKGLLTNVDAKHPGAFSTPEALRKAVCRADAERRGKHERTGRSAEDTTADTQHPKTARTKTRTSFNGCPRFLFFSHFTQ